MNAQRWLALTLAILFIGLVATSPIWLAQLADDDDEPEATPTSFNSSSDDADQGNDLAAPTNSAFPTQDPVIVSLMEDVGIDKLDVGDEPFIIMAGDFSVIDDIRSASGTASVYKIGDFTYALRLEPFEMAGGPDLHVILSLGANPRTSSETLLPSHVDLGQLKSNVGAQNYEVPGNVVVTRYKSVVIYSMSLNLVYSSATLSQVRG